MGLKTRNYVLGFDLWTDPNIPAKDIQHLQNGQPIFVSSEFDFDLVKKKNLYPTTRSGKIYWDLFAIPIIKEGEIDGYLVQVLEVTERKKAEQDLRESVYRSRQGLLMGVCRGIAEHFAFSVLAVRLIVLAAFFFTGFWAVGLLYIAAGMLMKIAPASPLRDENDHEFYQSHAASRASAIKRIKEKFDNIERRIQKMEDTVTSRAFHL